MSLIEYHKTTSRELLALTNKVRNLVPHWGEDGRYKEAVLKNVIKRFLPEKYEIGTGFVIKQTKNRGEHLPSRQLDLIIYDNESPILFKEGDFVILTPDSIGAIIEVKANLLNQNVANVVGQANENGKFIWSGKKDRKFAFFNGIFSFEGNDNFNIDSFSENIRNGNTSLGADRSFKKYKVNHISINENWFLKYWPDDENPHSLYNIEELSFSFFISNLIDILSNKSVRRNNYIWYAANKELNSNRQF